MIELENRGGPFMRQYYRSAKRAYQSGDTSGLRYQKEWGYYNQLVEVNKKYEQEQAEQKKNINQRDTIFIDSNTNTMGNNTANATQRNSLFGAQNQNDDNISPYRKRRGVMFNTNFNTLLGN